MHTEIQAAIAANIEYAQMIVFASRNHLHEMILKPSDR
jgi:hypothetical protein